MAESVSSGINTVDNVIANFKAALPDPDFLAQFSKIERYRWKIKRFLQRQIQ